MYMYMYILYKPMHSYQSQTDCSAGSPHLEFLVSMHVHVPRFVVQNANTY